MVNSTAQQQPVFNSGDNWDKLSVEEIDEWMDKGPNTPLLDSVNFPVHMKNFNVDQLRQLCKELRSEIVNTVSKTGGHLSSSLGVVELTVAMHYVFNTPEDKIIWDVGHQAYGHKILTGRRKQMKSIRQTNGLSGEPEAPPAAASPCASREGRCTRRQAHFCATSGLHACGRMLACRLHEARGERV